MSKASVEQFYQEILKDPSLQERLQAVTTREATAALAVELGKERGYNFTIEEAQASIDEWFAARPEQELSDAQLEAVAGGGQAEPLFMNNWGCG